MNAWSLQQFGEPDHFLRTDVPTPRFGTNEVLIRVAASSVNPVDCKIRRGERPAIAPELPGILQGDVAGTVEAVGDAVTRFRPGDEVYGMIGGLKGMPGALADLTVADADLLSQKPASLGFAESAALPLVTITAWEGLHDRAGIRPDRRVLIHAGTGGVGHVAVQLARAAGARVACTVSGEAKGDAVRRLAGEEIDLINYREEGVEDYTRRLTDGEGFDLVYDTVGGDNLAASFAAVARHGQVINILSMAVHDLTPMHLKGLSLHVVFMLLPLLTGQGRRRHGEILTEAAALADAGRLRPLIDQVFPFDRAGDAHRRAESGEQVGKVVLVHPDFA